MLAQEKDGERDRPRNFRTGPGTCMNSCTSELGNGTRGRLVGGICRETKVYYNDRIIATARPFAGRAAPAADNAHDRRA